MKECYVMKRIICCLLLISVLISCITLVSVNAAEDYGLCLPNAYMVYGDANGDGHVDAIDTTYMMRYLVRMRNPYLFREYYGLYHFGDVDCDGYITIMDVSYIQRYLAYLPSSHSRAGIWESTDSEIEVQNAKNMGTWMHNNGFTNPQIAGLLSFFDSQGIFYQISDFDYYFSSLRNGATFGKFNLSEYRDKCSYKNPDMLADYVASSWIYSEEMGTMAWSNHFSAYDTTLYESKFYELTADSWEIWANETF